MKVKKLIELLNKLPPNDEIEYRDGEWWCGTGIDEITRMNCIEIKDKAYTALLKDYEELKEKNKNLKLTLEQMENTCKDYLNDRDTLREDNRKLKENGLLGQATMEEAYNRIKELEEENRKLNEKVRFLEQCLDNKEKVNKSMRDEISKLKEKLSEITMVADDEKQSIEHILELEKENRKLRDRIKELEKLKSTYVYDAKQVRDIC